MGLVQGQEFGIESVAEVEPHLFTSQSFQSPTTLCSIPYRMSTGIWELRICVKQDLADEDKSLDIDPTLLFLAGWLQGLEAA